MIIETPYKVGDTVSIKLTSGEEVVARLEEEKDTSFILHKPLMVPIKILNLSKAHTVAQISYMK